MTLSKSLRIALIGVIGFISLSTFAPAQADDPLPEVPAFPVEYLSSQEIASNFGVEIYDKEFQQRVGGLEVVAFCNGFNMDVITYNPQPNFAYNCVVDKDYVFVRRYAVYEIYHKGNFLFSIPMGQADPKLKLHSGTRDDLKTFKQTFGIQDKMFAVEIEEK